MATFRAAGFLLVLLTLTSVEGRPFKHLHKHTEIFFSNLMDGFNQFIQELGNAHNLETPSSSTSRDGRIISEPHKDGTAKEDLAWQEMGDGQNTHNQAQPVGAPTRPTNVNSLDTIFRNNPFGSRGSNNELTDEEEAWLNFDTDDIAGTNVRATEEDLNPVKRTPDPIPETQNFIRKKRRDSPRLFSSTSSRLSADEEDWLNFDTDFIPDTPAESAFIDDSPEPANNPFDSAVPLVDDHVEIPISHSASVNTILPSNIADNVDSHPSESSINDAGNDIKINNDAANDVKVDNDLQISDDDWLNFDSDIVTDDNGGLKVVESLPTSTRNGGSNNQERRKNGGGDSKNSRPGLNFPLLSNLFNLGNRDNSNNGFNLGLPGLPPLPKIPIGEQRGINNGLNLGLPDIINIPLGTIDVKDDQVNLFSPLGSVDVEGDEVDVLLPIGEVSVRNQDSNKGKIGPSSSISSRIVHDKRGDEFHSIAENGQKKHVRVNVPFADVSVREGERVNVKAPFTFVDVTPNKTIRIKVPFFDFSLGEGGLSINLGR